MAVAVESAEVVPGKIATGRLLSLLRRLCFGQSERR